MSSELEQIWNNSQINGWKNHKKNAVDLFKRFNLDIGDLYDKITGLDYEKMQTICYLLSKVKKAILICDFLDDLAEKNHDDVEAIKVFLLISHAEIVMNNFKEKGSKRSLVKKYFQPVEIKYRLNFRIKVIPKEIPCKEKPFSGSDVLYQIRNDYVHEGNYTGVIFRDEKSKGYTYNIFRFSKNGKGIVGECNLTYKEFIDLFMEALIENIKLFIQKKTQNSICQKK